MTDALAKRQRLAIPESNDVIKQIAMDIGKNVAFYIETMYPEAVKASSSTFLLSVRNHTYNSIMGAIQSEFPAEVQLKLNDKHRRTLRKIRKAKSVEELLNIKRGEASQ